MQKIALYSWALTFAAAALGFAAPSPSSGLDLVADMFASGKAAKISSTGPETSETAASAMRFRRKVFDERPAPSPSATAPTTEAVTAVVAPSGSIVEIIYAAAAEFGVSGDWMVSIAECESGLNPNAYNSAGYHGLFQYDSQTWGAYGYGSVYDPVAQARTTAELLSLGQSSRWPNCA